VEPLFIEPFTILGMQSLSKSPVLSAINETLLEKPRSQQTQ
jgi:hypothetical protein